jgi:GNAT superfamily N-acetyltransferase
MTQNAEIRIRALEESELPEANRILRMAFGAFLKVEDPAALFPGRDLVSTRWRADRSSAIAAEHEGQLVGTNFVTNWGSIAFFGPITVLPEYWGQKVAQLLLERTMSVFDDWGISHRGLLTFPDSPKHIHLYEKYGFRAGHLIPVLSKDVSPQTEADFTKLSSLSEQDRRKAIEACAELTCEIHEGLDLKKELDAVLEQRLGEICLIHEGSTLEAFAICHCGSNTEAGDNTCYVKFGAVRSSDKESKHFTALLQACEAVALEQRLGLLTVGVNMGRRKAYSQLTGSGFQTGFIGVAMETHPERSYNRPEVYIIDDWR